ncbi:MAG: SMP-30/gluconolactonase/LRE family protein [Polyangiaceae bacterium]|nr:SMP-30/gluconolactonase/LRE family protein [Polyangiaceae bacterium]
MLLQTSLCPSRRVVVFGLALAALLPSCKNDHGGSVPSQGGQAGAAGASAVIAGQPTAGGNSGGQVPTGGGSPSGGGADNGGQVAMGGQGDTGGGGGDGGQVAASGGGGDGGDGGRPETGGQITVGGASGGGGQLETGGQVVTGGRVHYGGEAGSAGEGGAAGTDGGGASGAPATGGANAGGQAGHGGEGPTVGNGGVGANGGAGSRCDHLIDDPVPVTLVLGIRPTEDITFDNAGYIYWNRGSLAGARLYRRQRNGQPEVYCPNYTADFAAGMRMTPQGVLYVANNYTGNSLDRIDPDCTVTSVIQNVGLNGVEVDPAGRVYVSEFSGSRVLRYDPDPDGEPATDDATVTTLTAQIPTPNGLTLGTDWHHLYVSTYYGSDTATIYRIPLYPDGSPGPLQSWANYVGAGQQDGMAADECGNVYVAVDDKGQIVRINSKDPEERTTVVDRSGELLHNFVWGNGGGWSQDRLYIVSLGEGLYEADIGVRGKRYSF